MSISNYQATPSLLGPSANTASRTGDQAAFSDHASHAALLEKPLTPHTLFDLMYDGFYALFMLKNGGVPQSEAGFTSSILEFLDKFDHDAKKMGALAEDINAAKYAFCAAIDETILRSNTSIRAAWERKPLQLVVFGDHLAGEHFFDKLEALRAQGAAHVQALEIYHMCLLLGFQGKYMIDTPEKLNYLTARLGDEIALHKGKPTGFAPHWARPDQLIHQLRHEIPLWVIGCVFIFIAVMGYSGLNRMLAHKTEVALLPYNEVIQMAPRAANISITLP